MLSRVSQLLRRSYVPSSSLPVWKYDIMTFAVPNLINCRRHKEFLYANEDQLPPQVLAHSLGVIASLKIPLDEHWPDICVLVKRQIKSYDRNVAKQLFKIAGYMAMLGETNQEFWDIVDQKFVKEDLYRYLAEGECATLLRGLSEIGVGSNQLWDRLEGQVRKHYLELEKDELNDAIDALQITGRGSPETLKVLMSHPDHPLLLR